MIRLTEPEITRLVTERKILPANYRELLQLTPKHGHREQNIDILGEAGGEFRLILRQSLSNPLAFSVILGYKGLPRLFHLRRYNGKAHQHTNKLERQTFYDFMISISISPRNAIKRPALQRMLLRNSQIDLLMSIALSSV